MISNSYTEALTGLGLLLCAAVALWLAMRLEHDAAKIVLFVIFGITALGCAWVLLDYAGVWRMIR